MMTHANYRYDIMAFQTPRYYVAQVEEWDLRTNTFETWLYTADDLRTLVTRGTEPIKIKPVHGTTRQWFDDIVNSKPEPKALDLDTYFDMSIPDEQAQSMLDEVA